MGKVCLKGAKQDAHSHPFTSLIWCSGVLINPVAVLTSGRLKLGEDH